MTHTAGYDPSANGAGESAVGFFKRKCRHLLTGNRLTTRWWGVGVLAAAYYSRCAAGLEQWPALPFGTSAMVVQDPKVAMLLCRDRGQPRYLDHRHQFQEG